MANSYDVTRVPFKPQQEIVNWNTCTADEILSYEEEGQEVPEQYLRWAEEMSAAMNVQDDVTYEMANGEVGEGENGNAAQNFRAELGDSGVSLKQQGQIFITESKDKEEQTLASIETMAPLLNQTQQINDEAQQVADETKTRLQEISDEINAQVAEKNNLKTKIFGSREDKGELKGLQAVAGALANAATAQLEGLNSELSDVQATVNEGATISQLSQDYGTETVSIGNELVGNKGGIAGAIQDIGSFIGGLFGGNSKRKVGKEAIQQGTETITVGQQGAQIAQEAADANGVTIQTVGKEASDVSSSGNTDVGGGETGQEPPKSGDEIAAEQGGTRTASAPEKSETTIAQADPSEIVTDPNEILKRKEKLGLT